MKSNWTLHFLSFTLVIVGGLNWGLVGLFDLNLVNAIFGSMPSLERFVYLLVGAGAVYLLATHQDDCKTCEMAMKKGKRK